MRAAVQAADGPAGELRDARDDRRRRVRVLTQPDSVFSLVLTSLFCVDLSRSAVSPVWRVRGRGGKNERTRRLERWTNDVPRVTLSKISIDGLK